MDELARAIRDEAARLGRALDDAQRDKLHAYHRMLQRWGARIRLTGARDPCELVRRHLGDALALDGLLADFAAPGARCVDVGSGGGLPTLPLLSLRPLAAGARLLLIEANQRKAAFLRTALHELGLAGQTEVQAVRLEHWNPPATTLPLDVAWSLATFAPNEWLQRALPLLKNGGLVFVFLARGEGVETPPTALREVGRRAWMLADGAPRLLLCFQRDAPLA